MKFMPELLLPSSVNPFQLAEQRAHLVGSISALSPTRLREMGAAPEGPIQADLSFGIDDQGIIYLKGRLAARLTLQCQRCMEPFVYEIMSNFTLGVVRTLDEADKLPEDYEAALAKDDQLVLNELIENELILNLPIIPKHLPEACRVKMPVLDTGPEEKTKNPFQVLSSLRRHHQSKQED
jgi:uncharacterized protein